MQKLRLYTSNRLENLAESLAESVRRPLRSSLLPEIILVQSQGMARWLQLQLARQHGICSNCQFPFPRALSYELFKAVLPDLAEEAAYEPELLVWQIMKQVPAFLRRPEFASLANYLGHEPDSRKLFQVSERIANVFDQYLVFRPDLVLQWESGAGRQDWQAILWREVSSPFRERHPAALQAKVIKNLEQAASSIGGLPERISLFGISALPPFYLQILAALARHVEVSLYLLEPCEQFWGYISSAREQEQTLRRAGKGASAAAQLHLEKGNRLLASMGQLGRDFLLLIQGAGDWQEFEPSLFEAPTTKHLLARIQTDILKLEDRSPEEQAREAIAEDDSIQVHSCHSPVRELEVLYDHLLDWFDRDPDLAPRDVLVMIPEIELYAPYIRAVFGSPEQESLRIPFSIADGSARTQSHLVQTFLLLLQLASSRLGVSRVLALLEAAPVRRKFRLAEEDLELVRHWVEEVRIRWGQDQQHRADLGLPAWSENTWRYGLDRLLLGYAMCGESKEVVEGILPYDDIEGSAGEVLGRLAEFLERLFASVKALKQVQTLDAWATVFRSLVESFFEVGEHEAQGLQVLTASFEKLTRGAERAGFDQPVELAGVLEHLSRDLSEDRFGAGYLTGGVTFCALKPMRSIPAKVICLLGMNDRSFPRTSPQLSFDLMARQRRLGDRSSREDDRYLFLETLISARERLYISYVGQSINDNSEAPPSVVVSELLDYVAQGFELHGKDIIKDHVLTRHRLQAFSPAYFGTGRLFSYSRENLKASQVLLPERPRPGDLVPKPLAEPEEQWRRVTLQMLAEFLCNPAKFLAVRRLGLRLPSLAAALDEREAFEVAGLERYQLEDELLRQKLAGTSLKDSGGLVRASGRLPAGISGNAHFAQVRHDVEVLHNRLRPFHPDGLQAPVSFELPIDPFLVSGSIGHLTGQGLLFYRPAAIKAKDLLRAWVEHLVWNATRPHSQPGQTVIVGTRSICTLAPVSNAVTVLKDLLDCYWAGLSAPLKFFPESAYAFATADSKAANGVNTRRGKTPLDYARAKWSGSEFGPPGECEDAYFALFFRNGDALDSDFQAHARAIFLPLLAVLEETDE